MIQISLSNFKNVFDTKTYEFTNGELIHLTGRSGAGKSTVLCAFEWGLYGKLNGIKPRSKKDLIPKVTIKTDKISIDREGNDLSVITNKGIKLTSDAAQGHIFTIFGECDLWKSCSYLEQGFRNKLLIGSGEEKLKILRDLTYGYGIGNESNDPEYYLSKIREHIKTVNTAKKNTHAIYDSFNSEVTKAAEEYDSSENRWENSEFDSIEDLRTEIKILTKDYKKFSDFWSKQHMMSKEADIIRGKLNKINTSDFMSDLQYDNRISKLNECIHDLKNRKEFHDMCNNIKKYLPYRISYNNELEDILVHKSEHKKYIESLIKVGLSSNIKLEDLKTIKGQISDNILHKEFEELSELLNFVNEMKSYRDNKKTKLSKLKKDLNGREFDDSRYKKSSESIISLKKSLTNFKKKKSYTCPSCKDLLFMNEKGTLDLLEDINVDKLEKEISREQSIVKELEEIRDLISKIKETEKELSEAESDLEAAKNNFDSERHEELKSKKIKFTELQPRVTTSIDYLIENYIEGIDENLMKMYQNGDQLSKLLGSKFDDFIKDESKYLVYTKEDIGSKIKEWERSKSELETRRKSELTLIAEKDLLTKNLKEIEDQLASEDDEKELEEIEKELEEARGMEIDYIRFEEMRKKMDTLERYEKEYQESTEKLNNLEILYEHFKNLSVKPIEDVINCINLRLNDILDKLFTEEPIQVMLSLYRQSSGPKKDSFTKISVNLQVYHGNNNYPNISSLSGGEADRVSLALTLAMAEIFRPPIVMLDECMASLDSELRETCLGIIKSSTLTSGSCFIDICHESVEGYHDDIVKVA